jgi:hypothetical protein
MPYGDASKTAAANASFIDIPIVDSQPAFQDAFLLDATDASGFDGDDIARLALYTSIKTTTGTTAQIGFVTLRVAGSDISLVLSYLNSISPMRAIGEVFTSDPTYPAVFIPSQPTPGLNSTGVMFLPVETVFEDTVHSPTVQSVGTRVGFVPFLTSAGFTSSGYTSTPVIRSNSLPNAALVQMRIGSIEMVATTVKSPPFTWLTLFSTVGGFFTTLSSIILLLWTSGRCACGTVEFARGRKRRQSTDDEDRGAFLLSLQNPDSLLPTYSPH